MKENKPINNRYHILVYQMGRVVERYPVKTSNLAQQEFETAVKLYSEENSKHFMEMSYRRIQKVVLVDMTGPRIVSEKEL